MEKNIKSLLEKRKKNVTYRLIFNTKQRIFSIVRRKEKHPDSLTIDHGTSEYLWKLWGDMK